MTQHNKFDVYSKYSRRIVDNSGEASKPMWLLSFTDVMALMLTFFVLLYSMSDPEPEKWEQKIGITTHATAEYSGNRNFAGASEGENINRLSYAEAQNIDYLQALFAELIAENNAQNILSTRQRGKELQLIFLPSINLESDEFLAFIKALSPLIQSLRNQMTLIGPDNNLKVLQSLGNVIKNDGYGKPFNIQTRSDNLNDVGLIISFQAHDGRRIER
jgi:hypothetical protein